MSHEPYMKLRQKRQFVHSGLLTFSSEFTYATMRPSFIPQTLFQCQVLDGWYLYQPVNQDWVWWNLPRSTPRYCASFAMRIKANISAKLWDLTRPNPHGVFDPMIARWLQPDARYAHLWEDRHNHDAISKAWKLNLKGCSWERCDETSTFFDVTVVWNPRKWLWNDYETHWIHMECPLVMSWECLGNAWCSGTLDNGQPPARSSCWSSSTSWQIRFRFRWRLTGWSIHGSIHLLRGSSSGRSNVPSWKPWKPAGGSSRWKHNETTCNRLHHIAPAQQRQSKMTFKPRQTKIWCSN